MDEYEELAHWEELRAEKVLLISKIESVLGNPDKLREYISRHGEELGQRHYERWKKGVNKRRNEEIHDLNTIKATIEYIRKAREEVQLLTEVYYAIEQYPELSDIQYKIWRLLSRKHGIYLKRGKEGGK